MSTSECNLPEPDSGYFSPRNDTEELFTFDEDLSVAYQPKISKKESARRPAETQSCLDLDMSKGSVYRRRRRSFSDPFPRPASKVITLDISKVPHENKPSMESKLVQTCQWFTTSATCRCSSCYSTPSSKKVKMEFWFCSWQIFSHVRKPFPHSRELLNPIELFRIKWFKRFIGAASAHTRKVVQGNDFRSETFYKQPNVSDC